MTLEIETQKHPYAKYNSKFSVVQRILKNMRFLIIDDGTGFGLYKIKDHWWQYQKDEKFLLINEVAFTDDYVFEMKVESSKQRTLANEIAEELTSKGVNCKIIQIRI